MLKPIELVRLGFGFAQMCAPRKILNTFDPAEADRVAVGALRILGIRNVLQAVILIAGMPHWRRGGAVVDLLHAATMVVLATADRRYRAAAAISASLATVFASAELS